MRVNIISGNNVLHGRLSAGQGKAFDRPQRRLRNQCLTPDERGTAYLNLVAGKSRCLYPVFCEGRMDPKVWIRAVLQDDMVMKQSFSRHGEWCPVDEQIEGPWLDRILNLTEIDAEPCSKSP